MTDKKERAHKGWLASVRGFANENRLLAALLEREFNASRVDLPLSTYDIMLEKNADDSIRIQVKTVSPSGSISFTGGGRGGVDRFQKSDEKVYVHSRKTCDAIVGVKSERINGGEKVNFFIVPTILIEEINQKSMTIKKFPHTKNKWKLLLNCKDKKWVHTFFSEEWLKKNAKKHTPRSKK